MAVYTLINKSQLQALLAYYDIGELVDYKPIQAGTTNSNYELQLSNKHLIKKYVLTIVEQKLSLADLEFCLEYAHTLTQYDLPSAAPISDRHGQSYRKFLNKIILITPFLSGSSILPSNKTMLSEYCSQLASVQAKMHLAGYQFPKVRKNPAGIKWCVNMFDEIAELVSPEEHLLIDDELNFLLKHQELIVKQDLFKGAIHADLFCDNVLFHKNKLHGIIDFFYACTDYFLYDLAIVVNDWLIESNGHLNSVNYAAFTSNYLLTIKQNSEFYNNLLKALNHNKILWQYMLRLATLRFWLLRLSAQLLPKASDIKTVKDPTEYELKLLFHRTKSIDLI
jgi:homoserine kinase type II